MIEGTHANLRLKHGTNIRTFKDVEVIAGFRHPRKNPDGERIPGEWDVVDDGSGRYELTGYEILPKFGAQGQFVEQPVTVGFMADQVVED